MRTPFAEPETAAAAPVADNIGNFVALRTSALRGGEVAVDEDDLLFPLGGDMGTLPQELANSGVDLPALVVGRTDDQYALAGFVRGGVFQAMDLVSRVRIFDLADAVMRSRGA